MQRSAHHLHFRKKELVVAQSQIMQKRRQNLKVMKANACHKSSAISMNFLGKSIPTDSRKNHPVEIGVCTDILLSFRKYVKDDLQRLAPAAGTRI